MSALLLIIIYIIFISLGLPDSLIGSSWPAIQEVIGVSKSFQGILTITISLFTIISSFLTPLLLNKIKSKYIILISILLTVSGLISFTFANHFIYLCLSGILLGLGAGAIDTTLNNYVALNYKAIHLNFLHAFWGIGASISPLIIGSFLTDNSKGYKNGAFVLAIIQASIFLITLLTLKIWDKSEEKLKLDNKENALDLNEKPAKLKYFDTFRIKGIRFALFAFFAYIAVEQTTFSWFSSMMVYSYQFNEDVAANFTTLFFIGITLGRVLSGLISIKIKDEILMRIGESILLIGIILMMMSFSTNTVIVSLFFIGLGCGPIYPSIIHSTPSRFTPSFSSNVMAIQMGFSYIANVTISPLYGLIGEKTTFLTLPYFILFFLIILIIGNEIVLIKTKDKSQLIKFKKLN